MALSETARTFHMRFVQGGYALAEGFYGGVGTYGDADLTYGSEAGEGALAGALYRLLPFPGFRSQSPAWIFRAGDTSKLFKAIVSERDNQSERLPLNTVTSATLVLTNLSLDGRGPVVAQLPLTINTIDNVFERQFATADLTKGRYIASIMITFASGRVMTVEADTEIQLEVLSSQLVTEGL